MIANHSTYNQSSKPVLQNRVCLGCLSNNMKAIYTGLLFLSLVGYALSAACSNTDAVIEMDYNGASKHGAPMKDLSCNAQTQIDFGFGQPASGQLNTTLNTSTQYATFNNNNSGESKLQFLDVQGNNFTYSLQGFSLVPYAAGRVDLQGYPVTPEYQLSFTYNYGNNEETTIVVIYLTTSTSTPDKDIRLVKKDSQALGNFRGLVNQVEEVMNGSSTSVTSMAAALSFLNSLDYGKFISVKKSNCNTNFLINAFVYQIDTPASPIITPSTPYASKTGSSNQAATGDLLCYASQDYGGMFQTHMRQSYPLWATWFSALFFWIVILFGQPTTTLNLYDRYYHQNRWTSWEVYSLWHLAHEQYFTRMRRAMSVYTCFWVSCLAVSCLYGQLGIYYSDAITILWMGAIGLFCGFIYSFIIGFFIQGEDDWTLKKLNIKKQIKSLQDKEGNQALGLEQEIDECEDKIYTYNYWNYVSSIAVLITCWALSVHEMTKLPRQNYYQMWYWCGAVGVAHVGMVFVLSPIMTAIFGNYKFYQSRGFWYNHEIGEAYRDSQDS